MEADAELGRLASEGLIDIVQTTDSDVILFGAPRVIYVCVIKCSDGIHFLICVIRPQKKTDGNSVKIYSLENIFITPSVSLTQGGLLLVALLSGGDYDKVSLL